MTGYGSTVRPNHNGGWLLNRIGATIEAEAPRIRGELRKPEHGGDERAEDILSALDRLCPPEGE